MWFWFIPKTASRASSSIGALVAAGSLQPCLGDLHNYSYRLWKFLIISPKTRDITCNSPRAGEICCKVITTFI
jgi:hypothetical protein